MDSGTRTSGNSSSGSSDCSISHMMGGITGSVGILSGLDCKSLKQSLDAQLLVDCTLACRGGKVSAHKIVLSVCSSYLAKILLEHPVEHPIIILPELGIEDVRTLVHYMYTGDLLKSNTINFISLLRTAAILSINSLNDLMLASQASAPGSTSLSPINNQCNPLQLDHSQPPQKPEPFAYSSAITGTTTGVPSGNSSSTGPGATTSEFQFKCPTCQNHFQTICSFEYHMQRVHSVTSFGCEICHKPFASLRYVLTDHMRRCHGWNNYDTGRSNLGASEA